MTIPKKILSIVIALVITTVISSLVAWAFLAITGIVFWAWFVLSFLLQLAFPYLHEKYTYSKQVQDAVKEYAAKPFRKYEIPLTCQYCGHAESVDVDLLNTTYTCSTCERKNAVYVSFMTATIQS